MCFFTVQVMLIFAYFSFPTHTQVQKYVFSPYYDCFSCSFMQFLSNLFSEKNMCFFTVQVMLIHWPVVVVGFTFQTPWTYPPPLSKTRRPSLGGGTLPPWLYPWLNPWWKVYPPNEGFVRGGGGVQGSTIPVFNTTTSHLAVNRVYSLRGRLNKARTSKIFFQISSKWREYSCCSWCWFSHWPW